MNVVLTKEQESAATRLVEIGLYASKDEAIARSLDGLLEEVEKYEAIRRSLEISAEQSARGESKPLDPDALMRRVLARLEKEKAEPPAP